ncbi:MAG: ABC transporter ATP-binding protein, partial [Clostridia bacterium]|nr:ABC transporter ATP-binding protein [Clostridia bacterium]
MAVMNITSLTKKYPSGVVAIDNFTLNVADGESVAIFGLDRSGKSTLLRVLAGLEPATDGQITLDGRDITYLSSKDRNMAYAFRDTALDNNADVFGNLAYGLRKRKVAEEVIEVKVKAVAEILGLTELLTRKPKVLTALQRRRVALGRTIVRDPGVFLFDDPLSGLDGELRAQTVSDLVKLQTRLGATYIYATDDIAEAFTIGSRVAILSQGKLVQVDTPENLFKHPVNDFVAEVTG